MGPDRSQEAFFHAIRDHVAHLLGRHTDFADPGHRVLMVVNPRAGGLPKAPFRQRVLREVEAHRRTLAAGPSDGALTDIAMGLRYTTRGGEAADMAREEALAAWEAGQRLTILSVGGDGTHNEVLSGLITLPVEAQRRVTVIRLPMGTGNDSADAPDFRSFLDWLDRRGQGRDTELKKLSAVRVSLTSGEVRHAFNIASLGLDAYVVHVVNRIKRWIPGSFYRVVADVAVLFYIYALKALGLKGRGLDLDEVFGIVVMGASGRRTYGHGLRVLPDDRNFCAVRRSSLIKNIALKQRLYQGTHGSLPETLMDHQDRVVLQARGKTYLQLDGEELVLARPEPLVMEVIATELRTFHLILDQEKS